MSTWTSDFRFAYRKALKTPWMTGASVVALGAAMAVTIFGFSLLWDSYFAELPSRTGEEGAGDVRAGGLGHPRLP